MKAKNLLLWCCFAIGVSFAQTDIASVEYYFDADPGIGNGVSIDINPDVEVLNQTLAVSTTGLSAGTHRLFVRAINVDGTASLVEHKTFRVGYSPDNNTSDIVEAEYFINQDPGVGMGTAIDVTDGAIVDETLNIATTSLPLGTHRLFVRTKNAANEYSLYEHKTFRVAHTPDNNTSDIVEAEYFFNQDPGIGMGAAIDVIDGAMVDETLNIPTTSLPVGTHRLFIRTKNVTNEYSLYEHKTFRIAHTPDNNTSDIVAAEYFIDVDPGLGGGNALSVSGNSIDETVMAVTPNGLSQGTHYLYTRTLNAAGEWSLNEHQEFEIDGVLGIEEEIAIKAIKIYPNPMTSYVKIELTTNNSLELVELYNLNGKRVLQSNHTQFDVSHLANGMYLLYIKTEKGELTKKLLKQ